MGRPMRIQFEGALYHVATRGNNRRPIYRGDRDREFFLWLLGRTVASFGWRCHTYCLMGNHYHLLLETPQPNLAVGMRQLNGQYARAFNGWHGRVGHLFERRYISALIEHESHLLEASRYIVLNPVRAGLCETAEEWLWSNFRATAGVVRPKPFLHTTWLLDEFGADPKVARQRYAAFVADGSPYASLEGVVAA